MGDVTVEPPDEAPRSLQALDDHALIDLLRDGDERGLGELYRRHAPTALRAARSKTRSAHEADDVVADVFDGIWRAIRNGKGPTTRFEPYLVAAIRNRARAMPPVAAGPPIDDHIAALATVDAEPESGDSMARRAFATLASRDQQILWLTAVEGRTTTEAANVLSVTKRAATTLKFRAKRAFAEAYLTEYGAAGSALPACRDLGAKLSRYVRGTCPPTVKRTVEAHLDECPACRQLLRELTNVNATLRTVGPAAGLAIGSDRLLRSALRVAISKPVLVTAVAGVAALLPAALLLGGDPPTPGPTIIDEARPTSSTTIMPDAPSVAASAIVTRPPSTSIAVPPPTTLPAAPTVPTTAPLAPVVITVASVPHTTTTSVSAPSTTAPARAEAQTESGVFVSADPGGVDLNVAALPLVDAGVEVTSDGNGFVIDVALSVPLIEIPPIEIALAAISLPELPLPELDVELPLPDLTVPELTVPPTSAPPG